jgi:SAM-dependent methyltransferase
MTSTRDLRDQVELFRIAEGFLASGVLFALVKLGIPARIGAGERTVQELAAASGASPGALARLLEAGVAVELLERVGKAYRIRPTFVAYLVPGEERPSLDRWFRFQAWWYEAFGRLDEAVRTGAPSVEDYVGQLAERSDLTLAMHDYAALRAEDLVRTVDASGCRSLLDVGCGPGTYAFEFGSRHPSLELHLADLPEVLAIARRVASRYDLPNRVRYHPADVVEDELPGTHDLVLVSNALHVLGEEKSRRLVRRLFGVVAPGGSLVIQAQYTGTPGKPERWPALLDLAMLATTKEGRNHSVDETRRWMEEAGFTRVAFLPLGFFNPNACLRGFRP